MRSLIMHYDITKEKGSGVKAVVVPSGIVGHAGHYRDNAGAGWLAVAQGIRQSNVCVISQQIIILNFWRVTPSPELIGIHFPAVTRTARGVA